MGPALALSLLLQATTSVFPAPLVAEREHWMLPFASCSVVWDVASTLGSSFEDRTFFMQRRSEAIRAAQKMGVKANETLIRQNKDLKPELAQLAGLDPRAFVAGPVRRCSEHAETAARIAGSRNIIGAPGYIIE